MTEQIVLIGGLWLPSSAWSAVVAELTDRGRDAVAVTLPVSPGTTLDDQVAAVLGVVDPYPGKSLIVGHSAAGALAWIAADQRPDRVARVAMIGGFPRLDGTKYADFFDVVDGVMAFPGWDKFEGADSADLDEAARQAFSAAAEPVPEGVARAIVHLTDERRFDVPVTAICPEYSPAEFREWLDAGELPELARAKHLDAVDIDSGHWPMLTRPAELAALIDAL